VRERIQKGGVGREGDEGEGQQKGWEEGGKRGTRRERKREISPPPRSFLKVVAWWGAFRFESSPAWRTGGGYAV